MTQDTIASQIKAYLDQEYGIDQEELSLETPIFTTGILSSMDAVDLLLFFKECFNVEIKPGTVSIAMLDSIEKMVGVIEQHSNL